MNAQCAMCKAAAESSMEGDSKSVARGLNKGILFLLTLPYAAVGFIFRKELKVLWHRVRGNSDEESIKINWSNFAFAFSFVTVMVVLFIIFLMVHPGGA
jgi:hypothetical protein